MRISDWSSDVCSSDLARGNIHFRASRSPDLGVVREQLSRPPSAFVYIVDEGKVVHDLLGKPAPNPLSGCDCTGNMTTRRLTIEDEETLSSKPLARISPSDLDNLMSTLEVEFVNLSECVVSPGWRLTMAATNAPGDRKSTRLNSSH